MVEGRVLVIESNRDISQILWMILADAGFEVSVLAHVSTEAIHTAIDEFEPQCVLLGEESRAGYGQSWTEAVWLAERARPVPAIMLTASQADAREARECATPRSQAAKLRAVLEMPFDIEEAVRVVAEAIGHAKPPDPPPRAAQQQSAGRASTTTRTSPI